MNQPTRLRLFDWGPSPFCTKVRMILDYKRVAYERINVLGKAILEVRRRGRIGKVPALDIDGRLICDSTDIALELERLYPEPSLFPAGRRARALCQALEDWADESLYWQGIYFQWVEPRGRAMVPRAFGRSPLGRAGMIYYGRLLRRQLRGQGTGRKPAEHVRADLERNLAVLESLLEGRQALVDDQLRLCDFAAAAQLLYISRTPLGGEALEERGAIRSFLERVRAARGKIG